MPADILMREQQIDTSNKISPSRRLIVYVILLGIAANFSLAAYCHHWQQLLPGTHVHTPTYASTAGHMHHSHDAGVALNSYDVRTYDTIPFGNELLQTIVSIPLLLLAGWTRLLTHTPLLLWLAGGSVLAIAGVPLPPPDKPPRTSRRVRTAA